MAIGWSGYFRELLSHFGMSLPAWLATDYRSAHLAAEAVAGGALPTPPASISPPRSRARPALFGLPFIANLPAFCIVGLITCILVLGIRESASSNNAMVLLKVGIILFFVAVGVTLIRPENWNNPATGGFAPNGFAGISAGRGDHLLQLHRLRRHAARRRRRRRTRRGTCRSASS